ncbi:MAG: sigma 54-interacting transcriptional regulator, partial [Firmicutes bacterium]|nr:sigma 54-interacting transcriptional regulator [Bacillota bacterium]
MTVELDSLLDHSNDALLISDPEGKIVYVNPAIEKVTGLTVKAHLERNIRELVQEKLINCSATLEGLKQKKTITKEVRTVARKSLLNTASPVFDSAGNLRYVVSNIRNQVVFSHNLKPQKYVSPEEFCINEFSQIKTDLPYKVVDTWGDGYEIVFNSDAMAAVVELAVQLGRVDSTVLVHGETGVGKELVTRLIHSTSPRSQNGCFIKVNCASLPANLVESELFGYEPGAFTGALRSGKIGYFQEAEGGTLFLDEVAELPLEVQAKLLDILQDRQVCRVGGTRNVPIDVRILAATNRNLEQMVSDGEFRKDLYYRLNVIPIEVPPLRERAEDIAVLTKYFVAKLKEKYNINKEIDPKLIKHLTDYSWPGNVRELYNLVERLMVTVSHDKITLSHLSEHLPTSLSSASSKQFFAEQQSYLP